MVMEKLELKEHFIFFMAIFAILQVEVSSIVID